MFTYNYAFFLPKIRNMPPKALNGHISTNVHPRVKCTLISDHPFLSKTPKEFHLLDIEGQ